LSTLTVVNHLIFSGFYNFRGVVRGKIKVISFF
jgi:hypothetical protein